MDVFPVVVSIFSADFVKNYEKPYLDIALFGAAEKNFNDCRVIVHKNRVIVGIDSPRGAQTAFLDNVVEVFELKPYTKVLTEQGFLVVFAKSKGCGCGSRLKSWNPYGNVVGSSRG